MTRSIIAITLLLCVTTACRKQDMADQPLNDTMDESKFFADGQSARPLIPGTVPRVPKGQTPMPIKEALFAVTASAEMPVATSFPKEFPTDPALLRAKLDRGRQQFEVYCALCHGALGGGDGMIVQRGFPRPPSFYTARLRSAPVGHFYNVISHGYGAMYSYGDRVKVEDRWAITAYIRALQASGKNPDGTDRVDPDISRAATKPVRIGQ